MSRKTVTNRLNRTNAMKKLNLLLGILILSISVYSQNKIGVLAGINASSFSDGFLKSSDFGSNSYSFHLGAVYELEITENTSFRPKLLFSKQGNKEIPFGGINYETSYINIPFDFKFFNKPYILVGPQIGFLVNTEKREFDYGDLKDLDYGLNLGIGYNLKDFFIEFNIYQGLNKLIEVQIDQVIDLKATNTVIQFSFGYNFDF